MKKLLLEAFIFSTIIAFITSGNGFAQSFFKENISFSGYLSGVGSSFYQSYSNQRQNEGLLHNRLNLEVYPIENLTFSVQARNRFFYNETFNDPGSEQQQMLNTDNGWLDMSQNVFETKNTALNINIDRLYVQYTYDNLDITLGRQRINWGQTFVWNPNDIFNTYNYFELDYPERQGSDAIRLQYYPGMTSRVELAMNIGHDKKKTIAALYHTNISNFDMQVLTGVYKESDIVLGGAVVGNISSVSLTGEASYFISYKDDPNLGYVSLSGNYTFPNSLNLMAEGLVSISGVEKDLFSFQEIANETSSIKNLSFSKYSIFTSAMYQVNPLINVGLSGMVFFDLDGFYLGPTTDISITDNISLSLAFQYIKMKLPIIDELEYNYAFLRLKYNF